MPKFHIQSYMTYAYTARRPDSSAARFWVCSRTAVAHHHSDILFLITGNASGEGLVPFSVTIRQAYWHITCGLRIHMALV
jgi:hypothetical protein